MSTFWESANYNGLEWVNLTQMTIISATVGRNPFRRNGHHGQQEFEMQYFDAISKMTELALFLSKANHSVTR